VFAGPDFLLYNQDKFNLYFINPMIRKPRIQAKQSFSRNTSVGYLKKLNRAFIFESELELDHMRLEAFELEDGEDFEMQPEPLIHLCNGKLVNYTPDSEKSYKVGRNTVREIKYAKDANTEENKEKFKFLKEQYDAIGKNFEVLTEHDIRIGHRPENLAQLYPSLIHSSPINEFKALTVNITPKTKTLSQMHRIADSRGIPRVFVKRSIAHKLFRCDLTQPWSSLVLSWD
jgi:hypothetical protein